jgi:lipid II:glycine glycyltransferase (peptidoglycan interpeptide bridge formation enzyme)
MISFHRIPEDIPSSNVTGFEDFNVFQTSSWEQFLKETQDAKPVLVSIQDGDQLLGYFKGLVTRKFGFKMLGCPLRGWGTYFMGFNLKPQASRREILNVFPDFVFDTLKCHYFEILDPYIKMEDIEGLPIEYQLRPRFVLDLTKSEEALFANMKSSCRNLIRQSVRKGVTIEETTDITFVDDYYAQLTEVFEKQSKNPPYSYKRVKSLVESMLSSNKILLLRARELSGTCIATGIFLGCNQSAVFWGAASWRKYQSLRPNEAITWHGIKYWKSRGIKQLHFGGGMKQYKSKYGCDEINMIRLMKAKYPILDRVQDMMSQSPRIRDLLAHRL